MTKKKQLDLGNIDNISKFPFPDEKFFKPPKAKKNKQLRKSGKHKAAYEAYIRWSATPKEIREPKTVQEFEKVWKVPKHYTTNNFVKRSDFYEKKMKYFWDWVMDKFPDVVHAVYRRAIHNSTADARIFAELVAKRMESYAPKKSTMTPFVMVGVPQEKINALFTPENYEEAQDADVIDD